MAQPPTIYKPGPLNSVWNYLSSNLQPFAKKLADTLVVNIAYDDIITGKIAQYTPGVVYAISGFNRNTPCAGPGNPCCLLPTSLYDDGRNVGITIYMEAISRSQLSSVGYGQFYNPNYYGVADYNNTDNTGLYGIWNLSTIYNVGDHAYYGGYAWENLTGNVGSSTGLLGLNSDWRKIDYTVKLQSRPDYLIAYDVIEVDWNLGIVTSRYNVENNIRVQFSTDWYAKNKPFLFEALNPISVMAWGIYSDYGKDCSTPNSWGVHDIECINSYIETVNFYGAQFTDVKAYDSIIQANQFGKDFRFEKLDSKFGYIDSIVTTGTSSIVRTTLVTSYLGGIAMTGSLCKIENLSLYEFSNFDTCILVSAEIFDNRLYNSSVSYLNIENSDFKNNFFTNGSSVYQLLLNQECSFNYNFLNDSGVYEVQAIDQCSISNNTLNNCRASDGRGIAWIRIENTSNITLNNLSIQSLITGTSNITFLTYTNIDINGCTMTSGGLNLELTPTASINSKSLNNLYVEHALINVDLTPATVIFLNTAKRVFTRLDGTVRISYYNTTDTPIVSNINA